MLFLAGVERFTREELLDLLAFARAAVGLAPLRLAAEAPAASLVRGLSRTGHKTGRFLASIGNQVTSHPDRQRPWTRGLAVLAHSGARAATSLKGLEFTPFRLEDQISREKKSLEHLPTDTLRQELVNLVANLSGASARSRRSPEELSQVALKKAARTLKIGTRLVAPENVERWLFERQVTILLEQVQDRLAKGSPEMEVELEQNLRILLNRMSTGQQEAIRQGMGLDRLTAEGMLSALKSGALTLAFAGGLHTLSFGLFLAASTMMKAFTLLTGIGLGFGFYTGASAFLGLVLGPVGLLVSFLAATGTVGLRHYIKLRRALLVNLVAAMHYRLHS
jgi:hypothetical protein